MKAAVVLLASSEIQNFSRRVVYDLDRQYNRPFIGSVLPAHVSLKQTFAFEEMPPLESWFDRLAASIKPFQIELDRFYHTAFNGYAILGLNVVEIPVLRTLHERLNRELANVVINPKAVFDGETYRFHLTIEMGPVKDKDIYKAYFDALSSKEVNLSFKTREIALFYYADRQPGPEAFMVYKVLPLSG